MYGRRCLFRHEDRCFDEIAELQYVYKLQAIEHQFKNLGAKDEQFDCLLSKYFSHEHHSESGILPNFSKRTRLDVFKGLSN